MIRSDTGPALIFRLFKHLLDKCLIGEIAPFHYPARSQRLPAVTPIDVDGIDQLIPGDQCPQTADHPIYRFSFPPVESQMQ
ncbi:hypothetical protein D3C77_312410 [compost metagenome]